MRNAQKQEVLDCIESLHQAHEEIKNALNGGNYSLVQNMLGQCQEFAVSLGENIEKLEGQGHATVACLEEYCETLYHVYEELGSGAAGSGKIYKKLQRQLLRVESSAKNDIRVRKEVVFLPYKASMWDSLESVWKAADEDPDCDAYVIPIPYYDKNPNGSFGEMHYEGGQYPEYVPVVPYASYDFEKRRPDMIFIHNPYDECNYVTSVEPFFYSKNLKQFTGKLVYIPYFVLGEVKPDDRQAVDGMKHFCLVPGVMNADKVVVQSEDMRQVYINVLAEAAGEQTRGYWEEKILGLGSPKVDKVLNTKREDLEIPEEWLRIIRKPDGSWKKIILYNTSVSALLQHNEKMLEKIRDVLRVFLENRDEVALLWRPHPLIKATLSSMRPQLWTEYERIVEKYRKEGWGIYDDTVDVDRAICLSDAYYGDGSSVVNLCRKRNMLIVKQDVMYLEKRDLPVYEQLYARKFFTAMEKVGDVLYFAQITGNKLIQYNMTTRKYKIETVFYEEPAAEKDLFFDIVQAKERLYMIPDSANAIYEYDLASGKMRNYKLKMSDYGIRIQQKFSGAVVWNDELILIPWRYPAIIRFHLKNKSLIYETGYIELIRKLRNDLGDEKPIVCGRKSCIYQDKLYILLHDTDKIIQYGLKDKKCAVISLEEPETAFEVLCSDDRSVWAFAAKEKCIIRLNSDEKKKEKYIRYPENFEAIYPNIRVAVDTGDAIWCFPLLSNMILSIDKQNGHITELKEIPQSDNSKAKRLGRYIFAKRIGNEVYAMDSIDGNLHIICISSLQVKTITLQNFQGWNRENFVKELSYYWIREMEEEMISLSDFIGILLEGNEAVEAERRDMNCATKIFDFVIKD